MDKPLHLFKRKKSDKPRFQQRLANWIQLNKPICLLFFLDFIFITEKNLLCQEKVQFKHAVDRAIIRDCSF